MLITAALLGIALLAGAAAFLWTDRTYSRTLNEAARLQSHVSNLNNAVIEEVLHTRAYLITGAASSITSRDLARASFEMEYTQIQEGAGEAASLLESAQPQLERLAELHQQYQRIGDELIAMREAGQVEQAVELFDARSDPHVLALQTARRNLEASIQSAVADSNLQYSRQTGRIIWTELFIFLLAVAVSLWILTRLLDPSLNSLRYLETALDQTARSGAPIPLPEELSHNGPALFLAYNDLIARLEEATLGRLEFVGKVSHEMRSPLAAIRGYAEILANPEGLPPDSDPAAFSRVIFRQAHRLTRFTDNLVMAARIEEDALEIMGVPARLSPPLEELVQEFGAWSQREVSLDDQMGTELVSADLLHLREAFSNMIDNALRFSDASSPVRVALRPSGDGWVEVQVVDQGVGIAPEDQALLFRRFGSIKNERTRQAAGSGLGLYIAKHIVERHGGTVSIESAVGEGTTVTVRLPQVKPT